MNNAFEHQKPNLSHDEARDHAVHLLNAGIDRRTILDAFKEHGLELDDRPPEVIAAHEKANGIAPETPAPESYKIEYANRARELGADIGQTLAFNTEATKWCSELALPPALGAAIVERVIDAALA